MNDHPTDETARECRKVLDQHLECPPADALVSFREDELSAGNVTSVAAHLGRCPDCARLIEQLDEAESPMAEDAAYLAAREEDRHQVAGALGFRVGRPPAKPFLERLSWIWETRVPVMVPAAACALLLVAIFWPARPDSPVTLLGSTFTIHSRDGQTRSAAGVPDKDYVRVNDLVNICHTFLNTRVKDGTMVNVEITGPQGTEHFGPVSVALVSMDDNTTIDNSTTIMVPCIQFSLSFTAPGNYLLRMSHPGNAFSPIARKIRIHPN